MYNDKVLEAFRNPQNVGEVENYDGLGKVGNATCGDIMQITIKVDKEKDVITDAKFKTFGCAAAIATSSTATQMVIGMTLDEALKVTNRAVVEKLEGLPPQKLHCSVLAEEAIKAAIEDYRNKQKGIVVPEEEPKMV
ncbi:MAG TPA: Fe-S cluster assembly scaffold protein NifU [Clostridiales bacterium]|nr:Fe-S cluster assembly scaffold protein NifU [Clostridiales bacterium]